MFMISCSESIQQKFQQDSHTSRNRVSRGCSVHDEFKFKMSPPSQEENEASAKASSGKKEPLSQGGPTTEAGTQRQAQAKSRKEAKQERKRERNRKKRAAYRARNREKNGLPSYSKRSQYEKEKKRSSQESRQEKKERRRKDKKEQAKREKKERRRRARAACTEPNFHLTEAEREVLLSSAVKEGDFARMQQLFIIDMVSCAKSNESPVKAVTKRYRLLSIRFHPDKHASDAECHKLAFQALNEAHEVSRDRFV